ncbi:glycosyltransferase [Consotaella salsifontis]|uniref:Glycosyltransferase like family 2 n=1 Tax=Consotaella salsifontis TaxID=1365950 RepID=A0A1T4T3E2_9HYPH|nr:glycosyltransferase [Consotaella salsifontis]SKA34809.1 Glycosyltransferase like family 2 [Consotaella salsifontis]
MADQPIRVVKAYDAERGLKTLLAPTLETIDVLRHVLDRRPTIARRIQIGLESEIEAHAAETSSARRSRDAQISLAETQPGFSARQTLSGGQGFAAACLLLLSGFAMVGAIGAWLDALHTMSAFLFLACTAVRLCAAVAPFGSEPDAGSPAEPLPVYTLLVALYHESTVVASLVEALEKLDWPKTKLDIKLVCEEDDAATVAAAEMAARGRPYITVLRVPPSLPRTKPKALNFALPIARGSLLALYDAEDRPHPKQLRQAHAAFAAEGHDLACVQAPLVVSNGDKHWLAALFALEYAALFRGLLPFLAARGMPIPLERDEVRQNRKRIPSEAPI